MFDAAARSGGAIKVPVVLSFPSHHGITGWMMVALPATACYCLARYSQNQEMRECYDAGLPDFAQIPSACEYDISTTAFLPERFVNDYEAHVYFPSELRLLFIAVGFEVEAVWGDYQLGPLRHDSRAIIICGRKTSAC
jgi:hypothetical protein